MLYSTSCCLSCTNFNDSAAVKTFDIIHRRCSSLHIQFHHIFNFIGFLVYQHMYAWTVFFATHTDQKCDRYVRKLLFCFLCSFDLASRSNVGPLFEAVSSAYRIPSHHIHALTHLGQNRCLLHFSCHLYLEIMNPLPNQPHLWPVPNLNYFFHKFLS